MHEPSVTRGNINTGNRQLLLAAHTRQPSRQVKIEKFSSGRTRICVCVSWIWRINYNFNHTLQHRKVKAMVIGKINIWLRVLRVSTGWFAFVSCDQQLPVLFVGTKLESTDVALIRSLILQLAFTLRISFVACAKVFHIKVNTPIHSECIL
jgi:hypothetical protein